MSEVAKNRKSASKPLVTVSIVSHGDSKKVSHLLASIRKHELAASIQVIITDNLGNEIPDIHGSPWGSFHILRNEQNRGFAHNHNHAFQLAKGEYFCVLNPDVIFIQSIFSKLFERIYVLQADIIAPLVVDAKGMVQDSFRDLPTPLEIVRRRFPGYTFDSTIAESSDVIEPDWMPGIFYLMRGSTYRELGGMNEKYRLYFEDVEFCTRARLAGLKLLVDTSIRVQHDAHRASRKKLIFFLWHIQSAIRFFSSPIYRTALRNRKLGL